MTRDRLIELGQDLALNILGAADDRRDHPKVDHPGGEHPGHRRQPMPQRARELHLTHRAGMTDVLCRRDLRGHRITVIRTAPLALGQRTGPAHKQLRHRGQPLRDRGRLIPRRLTHHLDEIPVRQSFEHAFEYARWV